MALKTGRSLLRAKITWAYSKANTGFRATTQAEELGMDVSLPSGTYQHVFAATYSIAAAGTQAVDFYGPWTALSGESVTATKIRAFYLKVTGNTGVLKIEPHATDGLEWPMQGTAPYLEITPSSGGAQVLHCDGTHATVSAAARQWLLTNTGSATITVKLVAFVGTA